MISLFCLLCRLRTDISAALRSHHVDAQSSNASSDPFAKPLLPPAPPRDDLDFLTDMVLISMQLRQQQEKSLASDLHRDIMSVAVYRCTVPLRQQPMHADWSRCGCTLAHPKIQIMKYHPYLELASYRTRAARLTVHAHDIADLSCLTGAQSRLHALQESLPCGVSIPFMFKLRDAKCMDPLPECRIGYRLVV